MVPQSYTHLFENNLAGFIGKLIDFKKPSHTRVNIVLLTEMYSKILFSTLVQIVV